MKKIILIMFSVMFLTACGSIKVIPEPVEQGTINPAEQTLTLTKNGIAITVKNADVNIFSANLEGIVSAFFVTIDNQTDNEVLFNFASFVLLDNDNRQYKPLTPDNIKEIISRDSYYLLPYPYVGFYYLEDYQKSSFYNRYNSKEPYFYQLYPQDIYTKALPVGTIIPKANVSGLVYFKIDLEDKKHVKLLVYSKQEAASTPDFVFPFRVGK